MQSSHYAPWFFVLNSVLTGLSYVVISGLIYMGWRIRWRFAGLFAAFIMACGVHHVFHPFVDQLESWMPILVAIQISVDTTMMTVSVLTAVLVYRDWGLQKAENR